MQARYLFLVALAASAACTAPAPAPEAAVVGIVVDAPTGLPLAGALVRTDTGRPRATPTDPRGRFTLAAGLPPVRLRIERVCYRTRALELDTVPTPPLRISLDREAAVVAGLDCSTQWPG